MNHPSDRRKNARLRRRIDELLSRVRGANDEIVQRGLSAREHAEEVRREEGTSTPPTGAAGGRGRGNDPTRPGAPGAPS